MKVGEFIGGQKQVLQIEKATQVHQLYVKLKRGANLIDSFLSKSIIRVWNNKGQIIPPMKLRDLIVLNGDEYEVFVGHGSQNDTIVITYEICDEGSLNKTVYVELDTTQTGLSSTVLIELDSIDVTSTTAVKMRNYNLMNIVSPVILPKKSVCIFSYSDVLSLQKNNDLMGLCEILTHSACVLTNGALRNLHPVFDIGGGATPNEVYSDLANGYSIGYGEYNDNVIICTGDDEFLLSPQTGGCQVIFCQKTLTSIAEQVQQALIAEGQFNNVDKNEFASAVASVGRVAAQENLDTSHTQSIANKVVGLLPSVKIARLANVRNFNLASESPKLTGLRKTL